MWTTFVVDVCVGHLGSNRIHSELDVNIHSANQLACIPLSSWIWLHAITPLDRSLIHARIESKRQR
jgi:hypothetical protein